VSFPPITIRGAIKTIRTKPKKGLRNILLSCGRSDAGKLARLSLLEGIAFDVHFQPPEDSKAASATLRAEVESIDTRCETSERTVTLSYAKDDALKVAELGTFEQIEFLVTFTPAEVVIPAAAGPKKKPEAEI
jgi:hypothetical protein